MATFDPRDPRSRTRYGVSLTQQPASPLTMAQTSGEAYPAEVEPLGVGVASAPQPADDSFYGAQLGALEQSLRGMPQQMQQYQDQRNAAFDRQAQIERDYMNSLQPERSQQLGRFGAALMMPTRTGSFFEGFASATNAALDQRSYEEKRRAELDEKRMRSEMALAKLTADRLQDPMDELNQRATLLRTAGEVDDMRGDYDLMRDLGSGLTPRDDAALLADARANPNKYRSPRGQQMIADAQGRISATAKTADERAWWMQQQQVQSRLKREEEAAKAAAEGAKPTPLDRAEANRVAKRLAETQTSASEASKLRGDIAALRAARANTGYEGGLGADTFATVGGWLGIDSAENMQTIRAQAENLRLGLTNQLKGAISDKDMQLLGNATAGLGMTDDAAEPLLQAQEAGAQRAIERSQFLQRWVQLNGNDYGADEAWSVYTEQNPLFSQSKDGKLSLNKMNIGNWRDYLSGPGGQPAVSTQPGAYSPAGAQPQTGVSPLFDVNSLPPNVQAWAERQLQNGIPPEQVIRHLNEKIMQQQGGAN